MARESQIAGFVTRAPAARPVVLSGRAENGGGQRVAMTTQTAKSPVIQGAKRATTTKAGKR